MKPEDGNSSFRNYLIDAVYHLQGETLEKGARYEVREKNLRLYAVTDRSWLKDSALETQVEEALLGGATFVAAEREGIGSEAIRQEALRIRDLCRKYQVPFVIDDEVELALETDADGVHIGQSDMALRDAREQLGPEKIIGVSARTLEEALEAEQNGRTIWEWGQCSLPPPNRTRGCQPGNPKLHLPGGIDPCGSHRRHQKENLPELAGTGIAGVAVVSAIFAAPDIRKAAEELRQLSEAAAAGKAGVTG